MGRGGDAGSGAEAGGDDGVHLLGRVFAAAEINEGSDDDTDHIFQKAITFDKEEQVWAASTPTHLQYGSQTGGSFAVSRFKGVEIVTADKQSGRLIKGV